MRRLTFKVLLATALIAGCFGCSTPKMLEYENFKNFKVQKLGFTNSEVSMGLQYFNPNNFGLQLRKSDLDVYINNNLLGHSSLDSLIYIPRRDTFILPIKFNVDMQNLFKNAFITLSGKEIVIKVDGNIKLGKANVFMNMPVKYEGKHTFSLF